MEKETFKTALATLGAFFICDTLGIITFLQNVVLGWSKGPNV
jgi:hypothetical protein